MAVLQRHKNNIFGLVADLNSLQSQISTEVSRASGVEGSLSSLNTTAKGNLVSAINEVVASLGSQSADLAADLAAEILRAQGAEADLQAAIDAEAVRATAAEGVLTTNLSAEVSRATTAEGVLDGKITDEVTRATAAEGVLTTNLSNEVTRALVAEGVLQGNIDSEVTRALAAEGVLDGKISTEKSRAEAAEAVLTTGLATEVTDRIAGDNALDGRLDIIEAHLVSGIFWKQSFDTLADMETALTGVESGTEDGWAYYVKGDNDGYVVVDENDGDYIPASWTTKSLIKFADYTETSGLVSTERARALAAEGVLRSDLADEVTRAQGAEAVLTADLSAEVTRATNAESVLDGKITTEKNRAEAAEAGIIADLSAEVTRATNAESVLDGKISAEVTRATGAETQIASDLSAEVTRATGAEATLTADLSAEVSRATAAEATKLAIASNLSDLGDKAVARTNLDVYSKSETDEVVRLGGAIFTTETVSVVSDKITLSNEPKNGLIFNFATVRHIDANFVSYDIPVTVTATAGGKEFLLSADASGQFDGKSVIVQYAYIPVA